MRFSAGCVLMAVCCLSGFRLRSSLRLVAEALTVGKVETSSRGRGESFDCGERSTLVPVGEAAVAGRALAVVVMLVKDMPERSSGGFRAAGRVCAE
jgi:hypothetical protein